MSLAEQILTSQIDKNQSFENEKGHCKLAFKRLEKKTGIHRLENKKLDEIFKSLIEVENLIEKEKSKFELKDFNLIFRLINAAKKDIKMQKQLSNTINRIVTKNSRLAVALNELRKNVFEYPDPIDFMLLVEHTRFWKNKLKYQLKQIKNNNPIKCYANKTLNKV